MYDPRNTLAQNVAAELERHFGDKALSHRHPAQRAPRRSAVARRAGAGLEPKSKGALAYLALAGEMLRRMEAREQALTRTETSRRTAAEKLRAVTRDRPRMDAADAREEPMIRPKGLGRGLDALLAGPTSRAVEATRCRRSRSTGCVPASTSRARGWTRHRSPSSRHRSARRASCSRSSCGPSRAGASRSSPASAAGAPRSRRACARSRRSCKNVPDQAALALALIENIQREDLNPLEEAQGLQRLIDEFGLDARRGGEGGRPLAQRGVEPAAPERAGAARAGVRAGRRARHGPRARAAGAADRRSSPAPPRAIVNGALSVRETERLVHGLLNPAKRARAPQGQAAPTTPIRHGSKTTSPKSSAPSCTSSPAVRARAASSSAIRRSSSSTASSRASRRRERLRQRKRRLVSACALLQERGSADLRQHRVRRRIPRTCPAPRCSAS